jgi:hypothetical protein
MRRPADGGGRRRWSAFPATLVAAITIALVTSWTASGAVAAPRAVASPDLTLTPNPLDFGDQPIGATSAGMQLTLTNLTTLTLTFGVTVVGNDVASEFRQGPASTCTGTIAAGAQCTIDVTFTPATVGSRTGTATVTVSSSFRAAVVTIRASARLVGVGVQQPTLTLDRAVTAQGSVVVAHGAGYPIDLPLALSWSSGLTTPPPVSTDGKGAFTVTLLILPTDLLGDRVLQSAQGDGFPAVQSGPLLVVPGSAQPPRFLAR